MAKLITQLNRTRGTYQDVFIYTVNASFNGINEPITNASIQILFPDFLDIYLGDIQEPIKNVTQTTLETGSLYTFEFGAISDVGIAVRLGVGVMFGPSTANETKVMVAPELWINGSLYTSYESDAIQLIVTPDFQITHEQILPKISPAPNGFIYYRVLLKNYGDLGGVINNVEIICSPANTFLIDTSYDIVGKDVSSNAFRDTTQDGLEGTIKENAIYFSISEFYGEAYSFIYRVSVSDTVTLNTTYDTGLIWSIDDVPKEEIIDTTTISNPLYKTNFSIYGPEYSLPSRPINYEIRLSNEGNQTLDFLNLTATLPEEVRFTSFTTGLYSLYGIDELIDIAYTISYVTSSGATGTVGTYNTSSNTKIIISDLLENEDDLRSLTWEFPKFPLGFTTKNTPLLNGEIKASTQIGAMLLCQLDLSYFANNTASTNQTSRITRIQDICILTPTFSSSIGSNPVRPNEVYQYTIGVNCRSSRLNTPIFFFLLPDTLEYIGNVESSIYDYFQDISAISIPDPTVIPNFNGGSDTLIIFSFANAFAIELNQKMRLKLTFSVKVRSTARGDFNAFFLLDTIESVGQVATNRQTYEDTEALLRSYSSSNNDVYAQSSSLSTSILFFVSISSRKEVKGLLDDDFVEQGVLAKTLAGEEVFYRITLSNTGNADLDAIEFLDILPHENDTGVIETTINRESQFPVFLTSEVTAFSTQIGIDDANPSQDTMIEFDISYSTSNDPIRFGNSFNLIGTSDNWVNVPPESLSSIRSFRIRTKDKPLFPGESVTILFKTLAPYGVTSDFIAWNSFAADVVYTDTQGVQQHLLAVEPDKAGVQIAPIDTNKGRISGFVFWDEEENGTYSSEAQRSDITNDIGVVLYNKYGIPLRVTFTSTTMDGLAGHYSFSNLEIDQYYIRFFADTTLHDYSVVNHKGISSMIDLNTTQNVDNVIAGIYSNKNRRIVEILQINRSSKQMLRNVIYDQMLIGMKLEYLNE